MSSSKSSSRSPGEEAYHTAEEDHHSYSYAQGSSEASSTMTTNPDGGLESVYATANQTPTASPDVEIFKNSWGKLAFFMSISAKHKLVAMLDRFFGGAFR